MAASWWRPPPGRRGSASPCSTCRRSRRGPARFARAGLADRAEAVGGDFADGALPPGADVISLVRVIHDHDDSAALALLRAARAALPPGGVLLLAEPMAETPGAQAAGDAYFGIYLLAMGQGRPRSVPVLTAMLQQAGFEPCGCCRRTHRCWSASCSQV